MSRYTVRRHYYAVLKIPHSADLATITNAYKRLALEKHPDRNKGRDATAEFQLDEIENLTYELEKDLVKLEMLLRGTEGPFNRVSAGAGTLRGERMHEKRKDSGETRSATSTHSGRGEDRTAYG
ncbi:hypothetical protein CNMCM5623_000882 [Aspergillus felis]|uniref:J domain-containing protein n=1 Tax=Aspergillus felis TaxID=1287682 RepID=A0A8H6Q6V3_9EURO|nr:hypothetical protein CNMCM5623_000882 [Aspergillus felis]KAF7178989.1 hypothetical protein CNMCM7691_007864 [Aspergillus felis]